MTFRKDPPPPPPFSEDGTSRTQAVPCPFLGFEDDVQVRYGYPESGNYCHRVRQPQPVALVQQEGVCLAGEYRLCPVNTGDWRGPLPADLLGKDPTAPHKIRRLWLWLGIAGGLIGLIVLSSLIFSSHTPPPTLPTLQSAIINPKSTITLTPPQSAILNPTSTITNTLRPTPTIIHPTSTITNIPTIITQQSTITNSPTITHTPLQSAISTQQSTISNSPGPLQETPFGPSGRYLVHVVQSGEVMENIAARYHTSVAVLLKVNWANRTPTIWADTPIVILPGVTGATNLQELKPVWLDQRTRLAGLAQKYTVSQTDLSTLNALGSGEWVEGQRWIIIPK